MSKLNYAIVIVLAGCVSGPKNENRTFAEKLNGTNYSEFSMVSGVPIGTRNAQARKITGQVYCGEGIAQSPVNNASVAVLEGTKILASTSSRVDGAYVIYVPVDAKLNLTLEARSACGLSQIKLDAAATKETTGLNLVLR